MQDVGQAADFFDLLEVEQAQAAVIVFDGRQPLRSVGQSNLGELHGFAPRRGRGQWRAMAAIVRAMSSGNGASNSSSLPLCGCRKASRRACKACREIRSGD